MPRYNRYVTADRLRLIGDALSNSADQAVVKAYADELESLIKSEVHPPRAIPLRCNPDEFELGIFADILKKAYPVDTQSSLEQLAQRL